MAARAVLALCLLAGCGARAPAAVHGGAGPGPPGFPVPGLHGAEDPVVRGARLLPASLEEARAWGSEPGGGVRAVVAGLRVISSPGGELAIARDRLAANPALVLEVPERLGGGFLFVVANHVWRASTWLAPG